MKKEDIISIIKSEMDKVPLNENGRAVSEEAWRRRFELSYIWIEVRLLGLTEKDALDIAYDQNFSHVEVYEHGKEKLGYMQQEMDGSRVTLHVEDDIVRRVWLSGGRLIAYHEETLQEILRKWQELGNPDELVCDGTQWYSAWMRYYMVLKDDLKPYTGKATTTIKFEK